MSHEIDFSNGRANIAFVGEKPWHGLGSELTFGASIDDWKREAGLNFEVREAEVQFHDGELLLPFADRKVLYRGDTKAPLATVSNKYKPVQPGEVLEFFRDLTEESGFTMDTAGSLHGGKRVWALAKMNEGSNVLGTDRVMPYLLLATSFDGGLATVAKFTAIRVVCNNTITVALSRDAVKGTGKEGAANQTKVRHSSVFDAEAVKKSLGLVQDSWNKWLASAKRAAEAPIELAKAEELTAAIAARTIPKGAEASESKAYKAIMDLFNGNAIGSDLTGGATAWQWINSVTEYIDHQRGRAADSRMNRAWFGDGDAIKSEAFNLVEAMLA